MKPVYPERRGVGGITPYAGVLQTARRIAELEAKAGVISWSTDWTHH